MSLSRFSIQCIDCGKRKTFHINMLRYIRSGWVWFKGIDGPGRCRHCLVKLVAAHEKRGQQ